MNRLSMRKALYMRMRLYNNRLFYSHEFSTLAFSGVNVRLRLTLFDIDLFSFPMEIGYFRVPPGLFIKTRLRAQPLI